MKSHLLIVHFSAYAISVLFKKSFPVSMTSSLFSSFSFIRFRISGLMLMFFILLEFCSVWYRQICILPHPVWPAQFVEDTVFFFHCVYFWLLYQKSDVHSGFTPRSSIRFQWSLCLLQCQSDILLFPYIQLLGRLFLGSVSLLWFFCFLSKLESR